MQTVTSAREAVRVTMGQNLFDKIGNKDTEAHGAATDYCMDLVDFDLEYVVRVGAACYDGYLEHQEQGVR